MLKFNSKDNLYLTNLEPFFKLAPNKKQLLIQSIPSETLYW